MFNQLIFEQDITKEVRLRPIHGSLFENDDMGLVVGVRVYRNKVAEDLTGEVVCEVLRDDGQLVIIPGKKLGNLAIAPISRQCLTPGVIRIVLKVIDSVQKVTVLALAGVVIAVDGTAYIDGGSAIPDLSTYEDLVARAEAAADTISQLTVNAEVISGDRYRCMVTKE